MEKQRMVRGRRRLRAGLLIIPLLLLMPSRFSRADEGDSNDTTGFIDLQSSPANPVINEPWSLAILVNHPNPREVSVKAPRFPPSLVLERVRTESVGRGERWTRIEYLFTPRNAGELTIEPFEITVPGRRAASGKLTIRFRGENPYRYEPRFRWLFAGGGGQAAAVPGQRYALILELSGWDPQRPAPAGFLQGRAPFGAILEAGPAEAAASAPGEGAFRYAVSILPLEEGSVTLESFQFQAGTYTLTVPGMILPVAPRAAARPRSTETAAQNPLKDEMPGDEIQQPNARWDATFPLPSSGREPAFPLFRALFGAEYRRVTGAVRSLWDENRRPEALAEIRRNERDSLAGPFLAPLRAEMELALGLRFTENERWKPLTIPLYSWIIGVFLVVSLVSVPLVFRHGKNAAPEKTVTSRRRRGFSVGIAVVFSLALAFMLLGDGLGFSAGRLSAAGHGAVLRETGAYRVPDLKGAVNAFFGEGQPVSVRSHARENARDHHLDWCYAEAPDGRSGWIPREALIFY